MRCKSITSFNSNQAGGVKDVKRWNFLGFCVIFPCFRRPLMLFRRNFPADNVSCPISHFLPTSRNFFLSAKTIFIFRMIFFPSCLKFFVSNFVTLVTKLLTHITKFVIHVTKFVINFFCADNEKFQAETKKLLGLCKK